VIIVVSAACDAAQLFTHKQKDTTVQVFIIGFGNCIFAFVPFQLALPLHNLPPTQLTFVAVQLFPFQELSFAFQFR
jgi:hypothetical protein